MKLPPPAIRFLETVIRSATAKVCIIRVDSDTLPARWFWSTGLHSIERVTYIYPVEASQARRRCSGHGFWAVVAAVFSAGG